MITALSGTSSDRNTTISSRNDSASTAPKKIGIRSPMYGDMSTLAATSPVTSTSAPAASSIGGSTSSRRRLTSVVVASSCGPPTGVTSQRTAVGSSGSLGCGPEHGVDLGVGLRPRR